MPEALLEATGMSRRFGGLAAVAAVDLRVERGAIHGLIGLGALVRGKGRHG